MLFYLYLPHLPSQISFTLKCISRTFMHFLCPLCIKLTCLGSGLCESFHISELWVAHVRIWLVSELPRSSASARCYVLFVCKNEEQYTIELDSSFKQKAYFSHFISSLVNLYTHMHTRTYIIHQIEKQHQEDQRRKQKMMQGWWCYIKVENGRRKEGTGREDREGSKKEEVRRWGEWGREKGRPVSNQHYHTYSWLLLITNGLWKQKKMPFKVTSMLHFQLVRSFIICNQSIICKIFKLLQ